MGESRATVVLKVLEAPQTDEGMGRARIDRATLSVIGVEEKGIAKFTSSKRTTGAKSFRLSTEDEGQGIVRLDGLVRRNLDVAIGDKVEIGKAEALPAERVTIAPIISEGHKISFGEGIENFVKRGLLSRPVTKGDVVIVPGIALMGGALPFMVVAAVPKGILQIDENTVIELREKPVRESLGRLLARIDQLSPEDVRSELAKALRAETEYLLADYADALARLPTDKTERARELAESLKKLLDDADST